jgi:hypothetical protein
MLPGRRRAGHGPTAEFSTVQKWANACALREVEYIID